MIIMISYFLPLSQNLGGQPDEAIRISIHPIHQQIHANPEAIKLRSKPGKKAKCVAPVLRKTPPPTTIAQEVLAIKCRSKTISVPRSDFMTHTLQD
jgi:hypothetical protein